MSTGTTGKENKNAVSDPEVSKGRPHVKGKRNRAETRADNYAKQEAIAQLTSMEGMLEFWLRDFTNELARMNLGKVGHPYEYTNSMICWLMLLKGLFNGDYREASATIETAIDHIGYTPFAHLLPPDMRAPDYTTVFRRFDMIIDRILTPAAWDDRIMCAFVKKRVAGRTRECAVDSTALNLSNTNLWRKTKWGVGPIYRGWVKVHALVDVDTNEIVAAVITTDKMGDNTAFRMLTKMAFDRGHDISTIYADSAYEAMDNWKDSADRDYTLVVKFKCNCNGRSNGCGARGV